MKILVISDSHGHIENIEIAINYFDDLDVVFHLGDFYKDGVKLSNDYKGLKFYGVAGNNDFCEENEEKIITLDNNTFYLTHGHKYDVYNSKTNIYYSAKCKNAKFALFGHTHSAYLEKIDDVIILNPGSISFPRGTVIPSFAIIDLYDCNLSALTIYGIFDGKVKATDLRI